MKGQVSRIKNDESIIKPARQADLKNITSPVTTGLKKVINDDSLNLKTGNQIKQSVNQANVAPLATATVISKSGLSGEIQPATAWQFPKVTEGKKALNTIKMQGSKTKTILHDQNVKSKQSVEKISSPSPKTPKEEINIFNKVPQNYYQNMVKKTGVDVTEKMSSDIKSDILPKSQLDLITSKIIQKVRVSIPGNNQSTMEVNLKPEYLGKVKIHLQSNEGLVSIRLIADNGETANLLSSSLQSIKENLEQQGVKLQQLGVDLTNQESRNQSDDGGKEGTKPKNLFPGSSSNQKLESVDSREQISLNPNKLNLLA